MEMKFFVHTIMILGETIIVLRKTRTQRESTFILTSWSVLFYHRGDYTRLVSVEAEFEILCKDITSQSKTQVFHIFCGVVIFGR